MNDEIKKILIKDFNEILVKEFCTDWEEKRLYIELLVNSTPFSNLLDYITKLQKENERLTRSVVSYDETLAKRNNEYEDYKLRIDKAIDYIKILLSVNIKVDGEDKKIMTYNKPLYDLLNILQGVSNENSNKQ